MYDNYHGIIWKTKLTCKARNGPSGFENYFHLLCQRALLATEGGKVEDNTFSSVHLRLWQLAILGLRTAVLVLDV